MSKFLDLIEEKVRREIINEWSKDHWGEIDPDYLKLEVEAALNRITLHLAKIGVKR